MRKTLFLFIAALLYSAAAVSQVFERLVGVTPQDQNTGIQFTNL